MRARRPYLPGTAFHLISRTIGREPWLATFRDEIVSMLAFAFKHSDAQLHAYVIMSNHFHIVVQQGSKPLAALMQPLCRKIALRTQRLYTREGHIFERRYRAKRCQTAQHLRLAIAYIHRNPVKAGLSTSAATYPWSSHWGYEGLLAPASVQRCSLPLAPQLEVFASRANASPSELYKDYATYAAWCDACSKLEEYEPKPPEPATTPGDLYWEGKFGLISPVEPANRDLNRFVLDTLSEVAPWLTLRELQLSRGGSVVSQARHTIIIRAVSAGFRRADIARELNISEATVSRVAKTLFSPPSKGTDS